MHEKNLCLKVLYDNEPLFSTSQQLGSDPQSRDEGELCPGATANPELSEMSYRETVCSVRSYMAWTHIPDFDLEVMTAKGHWMTPEKEKKSQSHLVDITGMYE